MKPSPSLSAPSEHCGSCAGPHGEFSVLTVDCPMTMSVSDDTARCNALRVRRFEVEIDSLRISFSGPLLMIFVSPLGTLMDVDPISTFTTSELLVKVAPPAVQVASADEDSTSAVMTG